MLNYRYTNHTDRFTTTKFCTVWLFILSASSCISPRMLFNVCNLNNTVHPVNPASPSTKYVMLHNLFMLPARYRSCQLNTHLSPVLFHINLHELSQNISELGFYHYYCRGATMHAQLIITINKTTLRTSKTLKPNRLECCKNVIRSFKSNFHKRSKITICSRALYGTRLVQGENAKLCLKVINCNIVLLKHTFQCFAFCKRKTNYKKYENCFSKN